MSLTNQVGAFAASINATHLPDLCLEGARIGIADCVGVLIAGAEEPAPRAVARLVPEANKGDLAPEIPSGRLLSPSDAAFVNGVAAHVLDFDDVALAGHPSAVLTPAILAEGHALGCSGQDILSAYVAGYEVWALLDEIEPGHMHDRGFHPTAVLGSLATAAACARLHKLDATRSVHAIAISASMAAGLVANFGTMTKSLHSGRTAQAGVIAARLAKEGFTASQDVLEHRTGFVRAHSPSGEPDLEPRDYALGKEWRLPVNGVNIKRYPTCYATHRSIDALLDIVLTHNISPDEVSEIHVHTGETQLLMLRNWQPQTGLEAKFSMQFAMASALIERKVGLSELSDEFVRRHDVQNMMKNIKCITTTEIVSDWDQPFAPADKVTVFLESGKLHESKPVTRPKGCWQRRMEVEEFKEKFMDCAQRRYSNTRANQLFDQLWDLQNLRSVRDLLLYTGE